MSAETFTNTPGRWADRIVQAVGRDLERVTDHELAHHDFTFASMALDVAKSLREEQSRLVGDACTVLADADAVGEAANAVTVAVREMDPSELHRWITTQCELRPAQMAQVMMALGAWVNIEDETTVARGDRIESLSMPRRSA